MVNIPLFTRFYTSKWWLFGISEPSSVSTNTSDTGHPKSSHLCCSNSHSSGSFKTSFAHSSSSLNYRVLKGGGGVPRGGGSLIFPNELYNSRTTHPNSSQNNFWKQDVFCSVRCPFFLEHMPLTHKIRSSSCLESHCLVKRVLFKKT